MIQFILFVLVSLTAIMSLETRQLTLFSIFKPMATLVLLAVVGIPSNIFGWLIFVGIVFSLAGDMALLSDQKKYFLIALVLFLVAHLLYSLAFLEQGRWTLFLAIASVIVMAAAVLAVIVLWPVIGNLRIPVLIYALTISMMASLALATLNGPLPSQSSRAAAIGAILFFASDINLSMSRFRWSYPHAQTVTLILYWSGQLGIALAGRWSIY